MFSAFAAGLFLFASGSIGWNVAHMRGFFRGGRWQDGPVWGQMALGAGFVLAGAYLFRRLEPEWRRFQPPRDDRRVKYVGRGRTARADELNRRQRER